jgi:hypothetical protein
LQISELKFKKLLRAHLLSYFPGSPMLPAFAGPSFTKRRQKENIMNLKRSILQATFFLAVIAASLTLAGAARAQDAFVGKFTLTSPVSWGKSTLPPGTYSIRIDSTARPIIAFINRADSTSSFAILVMSTSTRDYRNGSNALRLKVRKGALVVHSLVLADLNKVLLYEPSAAKESVEEARVDSSVPVLVARK